MPGPVPMRSEERVSHPKGTAEAVATTPGELRPVKWPRARSAWSTNAKELYAAARDSGQSDFYQQTDIARLRFLLDQVTHYESGKARSSMMLGVITSELTNLLFSEGDRRRVRIELSATDNSTKDSQVTAIADYKKQLGM